MCGMGARTVMHIVERALPCPLVAQANVETPLLRRHLERIGMHVVQEMPVRAAGRFYLVLRAEPGQGERPMSEYEAYIGPALLCDRPAGTENYLAWRLGVETRALEGLRTGRDAARLREQNSASPSCGAPSRRKEMNIAEFMQVMEGIAPQETAEPWDNPGLLAGDPEAELNGVLVCVDATHAALDAAEQCSANLILSHHPLMFHGVKSLRQDGYEGAVLSRLLRENRALFAAHTNLDKAEGGVNDCLVRAGLLRQRAAGGLPAPVRPFAAQGGRDARSGEKDHQPAGRVLRQDGPVDLARGGVLWRGRRVCRAGGGAGRGAVHHGRNEAQRAHRGAGAGDERAAAGPRRKRKSVLEPLAQRLREKLSVPVRIYDERNL